MMSSLRTGRGAAPPVVVVVGWPVCRRVAPLKGKREAYLGTDHLLDDCPPCLCTAGTGKNHMWLPQRLAYATYA